MGEYIKVNGQSVKIGTCENCYYARFEDLKALQHKNYASGYSEYLKPDNGFRYRFPFPEEDGTEIGYYDPYNKGLQVEISGTKLADSLRSNDFDHNRICHSLGVNGGSYNVNIFYPCPLSPDFKLQTSVGGPSNVIRIMYQKQVDGELWTVIECGYCGAMVRLEKESAQELAECVIKNYSGDYGKEVSERIMQGYK